MIHINSDTYAFLADLKKHNERTWFQDNRVRYEAALHNVRAFVQDIIYSLSAIDPRIDSTISAQKCLFRIYRDTRFSLDKTPYKTHFSAGISVNGRKLFGPEYYLQISAEEVFIACGYWRPEKDHLRLIRQEIDYNSATFQALLPPLAKADIILSQEDILKRPPVGYTIAHEALAYLKLKSFVVQKKVPIAALIQAQGSDYIQAQGSDYIVDAYKQMLPFKQFLEEAIEGDS